MFALSVVSLASATITTTNVTSPTDPTYSSFDQDSPNTIGVSGTTDSNNTGSDLVDLQCFYGTGTTHVTLATNVPLDGGAGFSVPAASLNTVKYHVCRLRAVPAATIPADLSTFTGPRLATGERRSSKIIGGPNLNALRDFYIWGQQLTAADDYDSYGGCGLDDSYLFDASLMLSATTWYCNDWFSSGEDFTGPGSTRSELQVDGANAYSPAT